MNKKILAILMALLMVLVNVAAFAEGEGAASVNIGAAKTVTLTKTYDDDGRPAHDFTFSVNGNGPALSLSEEGKLSFGDSHDDAATTDTLTLTIPAVNEVGGTDASKYAASPAMYTYTLTENEFSTAGIVRDTTVYTIKVHVVNIAGVSETPEYDTLTTISNGTSKVTEFTFDNNYSAPGVLTIDGELIGNGANLDDTFTVTVTFETGSTGDLKSKVDAVATVSAGNGKEPCTVPATADGNSFTISNLGHDDVVTFTNLPVGVTYTIVANDQNGYTSNNKGVTDVAVADGNHTFTAQFEKSMTIETGVFTDNMPYFMLMAFVMMLAAAVVLKKRTVNE